MTTLFRAADLDGRGHVPAGRIDLGFLTGLGGYDDEISLIRVYHGPGVVREEDYNTYPGGPGFTVLWRATARQGVTMRQAARWWATYRTHPEVVLYRLLFTAETNTVGGLAHLRRLLALSGVPVGAAVDDAITAATTRGLLHAGGTRLAVTATGRSVLHAAARPSHLGESDPAIFGGNRS